ncbi:MAG: hypothetical protein AB7E52_08320 [Bdellovibrionales bacterium]
MKKFSWPLLVLTIALTACAGDGDKDANVPPPPPRKCPQVAILRELETIRDYGAEAPDPSALVATGHMGHVEGQCEYGDDGLEISYDLALQAQKGPRLGGDSVSFPFFVSVIRPDNSILSKELMTASFTFKEGLPLAEQVQPLRVFLPLEEDEDASDFRILMGFQLTEAQIKAERAGAEP